MKERAGRGDGRSRPDGEKDVRRPWSQSEGRVPRLVMRPLQEFLETEQAGGILLLLAAAAALVWANSPWSAGYEEVWTTELTLRLGGLELSEDLRHWINDALMALFFFVVGLEVKREILTGELRERRTMLLPAVAALGGMAVPALTYLAFNPDGEAAKGWGIPMATDIAFAVGILAVVGKALPAGLRSFLLALAIADDIGAILVIAVFYSGAISMGALALAAAGLAAILVLQRLHVRWTAVYVVLGIGVWIATYQSGVHATLAGVALGLVTPATPFQRPVAVSREARRVADETADDPSPPDSDAPQWLYLAHLSREAVSPLVRLEHAIHPWTSWLVVPLFALANAGVSLSPGALGDALASNISLGIVLGLVVGKVIGITVFSWLATRSGATALPDGVRWAHIVGVAALAGIGFTVSLFITGLAFEPGAMQDAAKVAVVAASLLAGMIGGVLLWRSGRHR